MTMEELADVLEFFLIVDVKDVVDKDDKGHLRNLEFRERRDCSAKFVATLVCLVALFRYRRFREERNSIVSQPIMAIVD